MAFSALCLSIVASAGALAGSRVTVDGSPDAGFRLLFNGEPYFIRGAGGQKHLEDLVAAGGNSIRTWGIESLEEHTDGGKRLIDLVADLGLTVTAGIWVGHERHGFDYYPGIDVLGVNAYAGASGVVKGVVSAGWKKPFVLTEFGPSGHWEVPKTSWGAPIEPGSQKKAASYHATQKLVIEGGQGLCLGTYVLLWGQKQEVTATWYGMFLPTGETLPTVDAMAYAWTGKFPANRAPKILAFKSPLKEAKVKAGETVTAEVTVEDPEGDSLQWEWIVRAESSDRKVGGDAEAAPPEVKGAIVEAEGGKATVRVPGKPGPYRLFVTVRDGKGSAAADNFPFYVSDDDLWLFIGSNGNFTAGRGDPSRSLFPYAGADRLLEAGSAGGTLSILLVDRGGGCRLWEPWQPSGRVYRTERNLLKHAHGAALVFEEINHDLGLRFEWSLETSAEHGLVRDCRIENLGAGPAAIRVLDGFRRILPAGVDPDVFVRYSYLAAACMSHERTGDSTAAVYTLNSLVSDRAEPGEVLRASTAYSIGLEDPALLLCERQVAAFRAGHAVTAEREIRGSLGACLAASAMTLDSGASRRWRMVADVGLDHTAVKALDRQLAEPARLDAAVTVACARNRGGLRARVAAADGLQQTSATASTVHHFANTLFNCMRGGTLRDGYRFPTADFLDFLAARNKRLAEFYRPVFAALPTTTDLAEFQAYADNLGDPQLARLAGEYLPLTFGRRHGDPSRPWNKFKIEVTDANREPVFGYEGNWRDIFQNWEALAASYPLALAGMIRIFLNASTADGYNPYRITRAGIDWEVPDPADPWSNIGYWGDHQIIYLLRLLESQQRTFPGSLSAQLREQVYASSSVPYLIKGFDDLLRDPSDSIVFDRDLHAAQTAAAAELGGDAKLVRDADGNVALVTLAEKLLVPLLAKLSNLVPGGGIWLNTQRPEWNDANNALAGWGLSVVTALAEHYDAIRAGLGFTKSAAVWGAFPSDPYSHTPAHRGAQQPGMTGQVKEEILTRRRELGVHVTGGQLEFKPSLLHGGELSAAPAPFRYVAPDGEEGEIQLPASALAFTCCQVPVIYIQGQAASITCRFADGSESTADGARLSPAHSASVFARTGALHSILVTLPATSFREP